MLGKKIPEIESLDVELMFVRLGLSEFNTKKFLKELRTLLLQKDFDGVDALIRDREIKLKTKSRAKLLRANEFSSEEIRGMYYLDYRFYTARNLINDVWAGEK